MFLSACPLKSKLLELLNFFTLTHFLQLSKSIFMTFYFTFFCFLMSCSKFGPLNCGQHNNTPPAAYMSWDSNSPFSYKTAQGAHSEFLIGCRWKSCFGRTSFTLWMAHILFLSAILHCAWIYLNTFCLSPNLLVIASHQSLSKGEIQSIF